MIPAAVLCWSAAVDLTGADHGRDPAGDPDLHVPIGRAAGAWARANWQALVGLSAYFLDVARGLPTLRAFNRGTAQVAGIREVTDRYRRTTMGTLRPSFLSGVVLDLAATLSTALVAVTLGVRLVAGSLAQPALTVLLLVPELYRRPRAVASLFHASADGLAGTERILDASTRPRPAPTRLWTAAGTSPHRPLGPPRGASSTRGRERQRPAGAGRPPRGHRPLPAPGAGSGPGRPRPAPR